MSPWSDCDYGYTGFGCSVTWAEEAGYQYIIPLHLLTITLVIPVVVGSIIQCYRILPNSEIVGNVLKVFCLQHTKHQFKFHSREIISVVFGIQSIALTLYIIDPSGWHTIMPWQASVIIAYTTMICTTMAVGITAYSWIKAVDKSLISHTYTRVAYRIVGVFFPLLILSMALCVVFDPANAYIYDSITVSLTCTLFLLSSWIAVKYGFSIYRTLGNVKRQLEQLGVVVLQPRNYMREFSRRGLTGFEQQPSTKDIVMPSPRWPSSRSIVLSKQRSSATNGSVDCGLNQSQDTPSSPESFPSPNRTVTFKEHIVYRRLSAVSGAGMDEDAEAQSPSPRSLNATPEPGNESAGDAQSGCGTPDSACSNRRLSITSVNRTDSSSDPFSSKKRRQKKSKTLPGSLPTSIQKLLKPSESGTINDEEAKFLDERQISIPSHTHDLGTVSGMILDSGSYRCNHADSDQVSSMGISVCRDVSRTSKFVSQVGGHDSVGSATTQLSTLKSVAGASRNSTPAKDRLIKRLLICIRIIVLVAALLIPTGCALVVKAISSREFHLANPDISGLGYIVSLGPMYVIVLPCMYAVMYFFWKKPHTKRHSIKPVRRVRAPKPRAARRTIDMLSSPGPSPTADPVVHSNWSRTQTMQPLSSSWRTRRLSIAKHSLDDSAVQETSDCESSPGPTLLKKPSVRIRPASFDLTQLPPHRQEQRDSSTSFPAVLATPTLPTEPDDQNDMGLISPVPGLQSARSSSITQLLPKPPSVTLSPKRAALTSGGMTQLLSGAAHRSKLRPVRRSGTGSLTPALPLVLPGQIDSEKDGSASTS
jgi:hypothetical protein